jgi:hypothetical protein
LRCDAFLGKPFPLDDLLTEVCRVLGDRWSTDARRGRSADNIRRAHALRSELEELMRQIRANTWTLTTRRRQALAHGKELAETLAELKRLATNPR